MRLLLVAGRFPQRSETFIYRKAVALAASGHEVTVGTRSPGEWSLFPDTLPGTLDVEVWPPDFGLRSVDRAVVTATRALGSAVRRPRDVAALVERVRSDPRTRSYPRAHLLRHLPFLGRRFDIVHFEFLGIAAMYPLAAELVGARLVVSCRGTETHTLAQRPDAERATLVETIRRADAIVCTSQELADVLATTTARRERVWVNRPAVDVARIEPRPSTPRNGPLRIIATGRLVWQKGYDHLLAAFARLRDQGVNFRADIIGDGELRHPLSFSIEDLGLRDRVVLAGAQPIDEVLRRMRDSDVFVLSSVTEGISNAVVEAMACGLPIVTTNTGGMPEIVDDGVEGFVVPVREPRAMADALATLAADEPRRIAMGAAARARALREMSIERQVGVFDEVYATLASSR